MIQGLTLVPGPGAEQCLQIHGIRSARKSDTFIHPALWTGSGWSRNFFPDPELFVPDQARSKESDKLNCISNFRLADSG